jgi:aspartyl-tRNA(Asn)/glutamyl-tRNA(Gln) amidotransferase subunit B
MGLLERYLEKYEPVIGLEVHAQLKTQTKIFCGCSTAFGLAPNTSVCPICLGHPGTLPVLNGDAVTMAIKAAHALNLTVHAESRFARKNYFYPDLPKGYQISQFDMPIATEGFLLVPDDEKEPSRSQTRIGIFRLHMEEDAGKLVHATESIDESRSSAVDYNRAGTPLVEIVSKPELKSFAQAGAYMRQLRSILRYIDVCDGNMEEGSLRCDANISIRPKGATFLGTRAEVKNVNSFKFVEKALEYEFLRQCELVEYGQKVILETRLFDPVKGVTRSMRSKEEASDYRYFEEPDLPPLVLDSDRIESLKASLPELPVARALRFASDAGYALPHYDAGVLTAEKETADYFEAVVAELNARYPARALKDNAKAAANKVMGPVFAILKDNADLTLADLVAGKLTAAHVASNAAAAIDGLVSASSANEILPLQLAETDPALKDAAALIAARGLGKVSDAGAIEAAAKAAIDGNPKQVADYRAGKEKLFAFFVGQVMKQMGGKADPALLHETLTRLLKG